MNKFTYSYPAKVYFGQNAVREAFDEELPKAGKTVMLAYGGGSIKKNGIYDEMITLLEKSGKEIVEFYGIMPNPTYVKVQEGAALVRERQVDFILAVGGILGTSASFAVLDPDYTMSVPSMQVLSGAFDTLSHAMETYFGNSDEDNVSDDVALAIMRNTVVNMHRLLTDINDIQARSNLMWDSAMAENGILKAGRLTDFQVHQIEHQLGAYTDCNHGQGLAVIQPVYYRHILQAAREKFTRFARVVFGSYTAEAGLDELEKLIRECGLPTKMGELKSAVIITPEVLRKVADTSNLIKTGPRVLDRDEIYEILMECMAGGVA